MSYPKLRVTAEIIIIVEAVIMITEQLVIERLVKRATSQKKISKFQDGLTDILNLIFYVNSLDEFTDWIWDHTSLDDVMIPEELKDFILPTTVRLDPVDRKTANLRDMGYLAKGTLPDKEQYYNALDQFRGNFKKDAQSEMVSIASVRKPVALYDVMSNIAVGDDVKYGSNPYIPIKVTGIEKLFEERYFNDTTLGIVNDYIDQLRFVK